MAIIQRLANRPYRLPLKARGKGIILLAILVLILPNSKNLPMAPIAFVFFLLYFSLHGGYLRELGLNLERPRAIKKYMGWILVCGLIVNISLAVLTISQHDTIIATATDEEIRDIETSGQIIALPEDIKILASQNDVKGFIQSALYPVFNTCLVVPVIETVIYFGFFFPLIYMKKNFLLAFLLTTLVFAGLHFPNGGLLSVGVSSVIGGVSIWLYVKTHSVYPAILFHSLWNLLVSSQILLALWYLDTT